MFIVTIWAFSQSFFITNTGKVETYRRVKVALCQPRSYSRLCPPKILAKDEESWTPLCLTHDSSDSFKQSGSNDFQITFFTRLSGCQRNSFFRARQGDLLANYWTLYVKFGVPFCPKYRAEIIVKAEHFQNPRLGGYDDQGILTTVGISLMSAPTLAS